MTALADVEEEQAKYKPPALKAFGGYVDQPSRLQQFLGTRQRPTIPAPQTQDTTFLRQQLQQSIGGYTPQAQPRIRVGMPDEADNTLGGLSTAPLSAPADEFQSDLDNALRAVQSGKDPRAVLERLLEAYPDRETEIRAAFGG